MLPRDKPLPTTTAERKLEQYLEERLEPDGSCRLWIDPVNPLHAIFHKNGKYRLQPRPRIWYETGSDHLQYGARGVTMTIQSWLMYLSLVLVATATPGPAVLFIVTNASLHGWRKAVFARRKNA